MSDLTTDELVDLVRRAVKGPRLLSSSGASIGDAVVKPLQVTWRKLADKAAASFAARSRIRSHIPHGKIPKPWIKSHIPPRLREVVLYRNGREAFDAEFSDSGCNARLLAGGQYLLFRQNTLLQCWSLVEKKPIWQYERELDLGPDLHGGLIFAFEVVDAGRFVIIVAVTRTPFGT